MYKNWDVGLTLLIVTAYRLSVRQTIRPLNTKWQRYKNSIYYSQLEFTASIEDDYKNTKINRIGLGLYICLL